MAGKSNSSGFMQIAILFGLIIISVFMAGGLLFHNKPGGLVTSVLPGGSLLCCDSGNGDSCNPIVDANHPALIYNNPKFGPKQYGLLRSNVSLIEDGCHLQDSKQSYSINGKTYPIIINSTENAQGECGGGNGSTDQLYDPTSKQCVPIPDDEIVYTCKSGCFVNPPHPGDKYCKVGFGDSSSIYDAYFRLSDIPAPGIPDPIKNCTKYASSSASTSIIYHPGAVTPVDYPSHKSLQLHTFGFVIPSPGISGVPWLSPYCKPALYFYPPEKEQIHVAVSPEEPLLYTDPPYPSGGWNIIGYPDGQISYQGITYDYLYYETALPDSLIPQEQSGFAIRYTNLAAFFTYLLPKLGLNTKEQMQFSQYWLKVLPYSPYYKITLVPQMVLNKLSPLSISPAPDTILRVTFRFEPIDRPIHILPPLVPNNIRSGFTVVEWGGLYKKDKNHPFTCLE